MRVPMGESVIVRKSQMKVFLILALAILASAHAEEDVQPDYTYFSDSEDSPQPIDLAKELGAIDFDSISFNLYTRENPSTPERLDVTSDQSLGLSRFLSVRPYRIITHGWNSTSESESCVTISDAYLAVGDYNVIVVDWSIAAQQPYPVAVRNVPVVAARITVLVEQLARFRDLDFSTTIIIGHAVGAHIAGLAARGVRGNIGAVVALDPARRLFQTAEPGSRVDSSDADYVQVIHTNGGQHGLMLPVGDSNFYPNGGRVQPGCFEVSGYCSHSRAYLYFAESILNPTGFPANRMRDIGLPILNEDQYYMGGRDLDTNVVGMFHLRTRATPPYGRQ